jgi:hypothetical protein
MKSRSLEDGDPWEDVQRLRGIAKIEFDYFKDLATSQRIRQAMREIGFDKISERTGINITDNEEDRLQVSFGKRKVPYPNLNGERFAETGASLVYSRSEFGTVAIILAPCKSDMAYMAEKHIFIGFGHFTGHQLSSRLHSDLRKLLRYQYVSSIGLRPNAWQRLWLRFAIWRYPRGTEEGFKFGQGRDHLRSAFAFTGSIAMTMILQPLLTALFVALLLYLDLGEYATSLRSGN